MNNMENFIPPHVPPELVRDIDLFNLPGMSEDVHLAWKRAQDSSPDIYFTPRYGGYWVMNRADLIAKAFSDFGTFSSLDAIAIPRVGGASRSLPIDVDPPEQRFFRAPINTALMPKAVHRLAEDARKLAIELIDELKPKGQCEFMEAFAKHLPITIFLRMVDLPLSDKDWLMDHASRAARGGSEAERMQIYTEMYGYLEGWVNKRRENPGVDLISEIIKIKIADRPITQEEILGECVIVLFGGLDTVAMTMGFMASFLARNPKHRRQLVEQPDLIPQAIEELLRRHSIPTLGRRLTRDIDIDGVLMKAGDYVMLSTPLHGLDERTWPDALNVDFNRAPQGHMAFGKGPHMCPGSNLARTELRIFVEEWLKRIPDFSIKAGTAPVTVSGAVAGMLELHLEWQV